MTDSPATAPPSSPDAPPPSRRRDADASHHGHALWEGRLAAEPSQALTALNDSLRFDRRLYREDIAGSRAHVSMLAKVGLLTPAERDEIHAALDTVQTEISQGVMAWKAGDEDIHTAIERRATELSPVAAKMHAGRSRNDQVAADLRLWVRRAISEVKTIVLDLAHTLEERAMEAYADDIVLAGYTHLQQAQPVLLAHHLAAHAWALLRDADRLSQARRRTDVSPLGAGALAGSSLPLDPAATAATLGFGAVFQNSLDAVSDRDFVADVLYAVALCGVHLSRLGEELVLWSSAEFGFVEFDDAHATGSSMMPQKKNPDVAELARAKAGRLIGNLTGFLATLKGLPLSYNKDLQEDKEALFDTIDTIQLVGAALRAVVADARFNAAAMAASAANPFAAATDLADWLVVRGTPFRKAYAIVAELVREAVASEPGAETGRETDSGTGAESGAETGRETDPGTGAEPSPETDAGASAPTAAADRFVELVTAHRGLGPEAAELLRPGAAVIARDSPGGGGAAVAAQLGNLRAAIAAARSD